MFTTLRLYDMLHHVALSGVQSRICNDFEYIEQKSIGKIF